MPGLKSSKIIHTNKAGNTANTSCGRVGRGGFAHFPADQRMDRRTDGRTKPLRDNTPKRQNKAGYTGQDGAPGVINS